MQDDLSEHLLKEWKISAVYFIYIQPIILFLNMLISVTCITLIQVLLLFPCDMIKLGEYGRKRIVIEYPDQMERNGGRMYSYSSEDAYVNNNVS